MDEVDKLYVDSIVMAQGAAIAALMMVQELTLQVGGERPDSDAWLRELAESVSARIDAKTKDGEPRAIATARQMSEGAFASVAASLRRGK